MRRLTCTFVLPLLSVCAMAEGRATMEFNSGEKSSVSLISLDSMQSDTKEHSVYVSYPSSEASNAKFTDAVSESKVDLKKGDKPSQFNQISEIKITLDKEYTYSFDDSRSLSVAAYGVKKVSVEVESLGSYVFLNGKKIDGKSELSSGKNEIKVIAYNGDVCTYTINVLKPESETISIEASDLSGDYTALNSIKVGSTGLSAGKIKAKGGKYEANKKNSFNLKFDEKVSILGITKNKRWTIEHCNSDATFLRNIVAEYVCSKLSSDWTPAMKLVNVTINGEYKGAYMLKEIPRVCKGRVEEGLLMSVETEADAEDNYFVSSETGTMFVAKDPETGMTGAKIFRAQDLIVKLEKAMKKGDWNTVNEILDVKSVARWVVANEFAKNEKSFGGDTYMYVDESNKIHFITSVEASKSFDAAGSTEGFTAMNRAWMTLLKSDSEFTKALASELNTLVSMKSAIIESISAQAEKTKADALANDILWGELGGAVMSSSNYDLNVAKLQEWISARIDFLKANLK